MATVVLVHGIAQEQLGAEVLLTDWLRALSDGVREFGNTALADRIFSGGRPGDIDVRMAYYGRLFLDDDPLPETATRADLENTPLPRGTDEGLLGELAQTVLEAAATAASDETDRANAENSIKILAGQAGPEQGPRALARPLLNFLSGLRWFADPTMALAAPLVWRTLTQVSRYLSDDTIRTEAQQRVLDLIDTDTKLVIGHSLGSVVAYESLHHSTQPTALITLGSPLGLRNVIYAKGKLRPWPAHVPATVKSWYNFAAEDDLVAARLDIAEYFPPAEGKKVTPISHIVDTGCKPHDIVHYLTKRSCGQAVALALA
jgi:hypothetical protein